MKLPDKNIWILLILFLLVFCTHYESNVVTPSDSRWTIPTAFSILKEHTSSLDQYHDQLLWSQYYAIDSVNHHYYSKFPIGTTLIALPFVYVIDKFSKRVLRMDIYQKEIEDPYTGIELLIASFLVALTAVFIFLIAKLILKSYFLSVLITFIFAFCTSAWSTASRALWPHGPSMLVLSMALYLLLKAKEKPKLVIWSALPLAFSYVIRATDFLPILFLSIYIFVNYRSYFIRYVLMSLVIAIPFFIYNYSIYKTLFTPYYLGYNQGHCANYPEAIIGNLFSPARGLFIFSPILLFSIVGMIVRLKNNTFKRLDFYMVIMLLTYLLFFSWMKLWWAGWCFGPRYFTDVLPFLIYFLIMAFKWIGEKGTTSKLTFTCLLIPLIVASFYINYRGATHWSTWEWNYKPNYISDHTERLWQWNDLQFLR